MEKAKFADSYQKYADAIYRHCYYKVYDREQARDLAQQTFARVWEYLTQGKQIKNMRAFLYQTARNLVVDYYRSKKPVSLDDLREDGFEPAGNAGEDPVQKLESEDIKRLLLKLKEDERELIIMRYIDGLKPQEIAEVMDETANVISVRLHRAGKNFKKICQQHGYQLWKNLTNN